MSTTIETAENKPLAEETGESSLVRLKHELAVQKSIPFVYEYPTKIDSDSKCFQANELTYAIHRMGEWEQKIFKTLISQIKATDSVAMKYNIKIHDLLRVLEGEGSQNFTRVWEVLRKLSNQRLRIQETNTTTTYKEGKFDSTLEVPFIGHFRDFPKLGIVEISFSIELMPYLLNLKKNFTVLNLEEFMSLSGSYSLRFYEYCSSYRSTGWFIISLDVLKEKLMVGKKYDKFADFRRFVLDAAKDELDKNSNITFDYCIQSKKGRKVDKLFFTVNNKKADKSEEEKKIEGRLMGEFKVSPSFTKKIMEKLDKKEIFKTLYEINEVRHSSKGIASIGGYTYSTFKAKYPVLDGKNGTKEAEVVAMNKEAVEGIAKLAGIPFAEYLNRLNLMIDNDGMVVKRG